MNILINRGSFSFALQLRKLKPRRLMDTQRKRPNIFTAQDKKITYNPFQAMQLLKVHSFTSFPETVEVCIQLGVNPKNGDQLVRGSAFMPAGLGKTTKVAVLCDESLRPQLQKLGVDKFIDKQGLAQIGKGNTDFQMLFTTPEYLPKLKAFGKILGPRGLMPNPKVGTLTSQKQLGNSIVRAKAGQVNFRVDSGKNVHSQIGKMSFTNQELLRNMKSLMNAIQDKKPVGLKGKYILGGFIKTTMGPRWKLNVEQLDPKSNKNVWSLVE